MRKDEFLNKFKKILDDTWDLVQKKNQQYGDLDALANFKTGAQIMYPNGPADLPGMYKVLQGYMNKHVAHVYNNCIDGEKVRESLGDIVVYSIIGMIMIDEDAKDRCKEAEKVIADTVDKIAENAAKTADEKKFIDFHCDCEECRKAEAENAGRIGVIAISQEDFNKMGPDVIGKVIAKIIEKETKGNE